MEMKHIQGASKVLTIFNFLTWAVVTCVLALSFFQMFDNLILLSV